MTCRNGTSCHLPTDSQQSSRELGPSFVRVCQSQTLRLASCENNNNVASCCHNYLAQSVLPTKRSARVVLLVHHLFNFVFFFALPTKIRRIACKGRSSSSDRTDLTIRGMCDTRENGNGLLRHLTFRAYLPTVERKQITLHSFILQSYFVCLRN